jgi:O-antigen/teichoic acid export membrane protein
VSVISLQEGRAKRWVGILSAYFTAQTLTQLLGIAAGLLLVRFLPVGEFALYTLALSVTTFFTFVSDLGSTTSLVYFFHRTRSEGEDFQPYLAAVLSLRRAVFLLGALTVAAAFPLLAGAKGYGLRESLLVTGGIVLGVWFQISSSIRVLALRLADRYGQSYRAEVTGGGLRFVLVLALLASRLLWAWLAVLASTVASAAVATLARPVEGTRSGIDLRPYRRRVLRYLLPTLPGALYFSVQGPLVVWLAATFGGTHNIAEVGALGRLSLVVGLLSGLIGTVFLPRLAWIKDERQYRLRFFQFGGALLAAASVLVLAAALAPRLFLLLLGPNYAGLKTELLLVVSASALNLLDGYVVNVNLARSWTRWQSACLGVQIAAQAILMTLLPLASTSNLLLFNLLSAAIALALQLATALTGFSRPARVHWS